MRPAIRAVDERAGRDRIDEEVARAREVEELADHAFQVGKLDRELVFGPVGFFARFAVGAIGFFRALGHFSGGFLGQVFPVILAVVVDGVVQVLYVVRSDAKRALLSAARFDGRFHDHGFFNGFFHGLLGRLLGRLGGERRTVLRLFRIARGQKEKGENRGGKFLHVLGLPRVKGEGNLAI